MQTKLCSTVSRNLAFSMKNAGIWPLNVGTYSTNYLCWNMATKCGNIQHQLSRFINITYTWA
uniref:Uncharacterized protein n=1 Tax=Arundo donax TaxID=35708 RepID=A0A0A9GWD2_ARUDO